MVAVVASVFLGGLAIRAGTADGFRYFGPIRAGAIYARPGVLLPGQKPAPGTGYDGQFYFYLAQDPFLTRSDTAAALDNTFRYRRFLYPLVVWMSSLGQRSLVPVVMVLVNLFALVALAALLARHAASRGRSPLAALTVIAFGGTWIPLLLDLTEPIQLLLLTIGITAGSATLLLAATVAKETAGVALATQALRGLMARDWGAVLRNGGALALFLAWAVAVHGSVHGAHFNTYGAHTLDPPGAPFLVLLNPGGVAQEVVALPAVAICVLALVRLGWRRDPAAWAAAAYALAAMTGGFDTWRDPVAFYRVIAGTVVLTFLSWTGTGDRLGWISNALALVSGLMALTAVLA